MQSAKIAEPDARSSGNLSAEPIAAVARGGCWVDYATVYYWYQKSPGGFTHKPLAPPAERRKVLLKSSKQVKDKAPKKDAAEQK